MEDNYRTWLICFIILSVIFGIIAGCDHQSWWWGIGTTIVSVILFHVGYFLGLIADGIEYNRNNRNKEDDEED